MSFEDSYLGKLREKIGHDLVHSPGSRCILEDSKGKILLQHRSDFKKWSLPGGSIETEEDIIESAIREVEEETGLIMENPVAYGFAQNPSYEIVTYPNGDVLRNFDLCLYCTSWSGTQIVSNEETLALDFFYPEKLPEEIMPNLHITIENFLEYKRTDEFQIF